MWMRYLGATSASSAYMLSVPLFAPQESLGNIIGRMRYLVASSATFQGAFQVKDDRVLKGPLGRSLRSFARTAHSAHSLRSAPLRSVHRLAHSLRSLPRGTVEILEYVFTLLSRFTGTNTFLALTRNTLNFMNFNHHMG